MTLEERKSFVNNCNEQNPNWDSNIDGLTLEDFLVNIKSSFNWDLAIENWGFWDEVYSRFTTYEISEVINLKKL